MQNFGKGNLQITKLMVISLVLVSGIAEEDVAVGLISLVSGVVEEDVAVGLISLVS